MGILNGKRVLITGLLSNRSIAYGIAKAMQREGAQLAFTYQSDKLKQRVIDLAQEFNTPENLILPCDVSEDAQIEELFNLLGKTWDGLEGLVHSIAFAPRETIHGDYVLNTDRESFRIAHDISSYSFVALARAALPLLEKGNNPALLTLSYLGAERTVVNYNVMGLAKASLEANVRYMAQSLGEKNIRVNAISAGPIRTLAASGIGGFSKILDLVEKQAPLHRNVTIDEVGNVAAFLTSDLASGVTANVTHVDSGFHAVAVGAM